MRRIAPQPPLLLLSFLSLTLATGCQSAGAQFLSLIGVQKKSVVVALVAGPDVGALAIANPFGPYWKLQTALHEELGRPVPINLCYRFQLESSLASGISHLAIVSPVDYAALKNRERFTVLAVTADEHGRVARPALLVVADDSPIRSVEDLRGEVVAFGPPGDARTHQAALVLLADHGLKKTDLSLELLPLPGSLKHMPTMRSVAQSVINASSAAGFIDEAAWAAFPEHAERENEPARDELRVIGRTLALPDRLVVSSPKLDQAMTDKVRRALLAVDREHPEALRPLRISSYQGPTEELLEACRRLAKSDKPDEGPGPGE